MKFDTAKLKKIGDTMIETLDDIRVGAIAMGQLSAGVAKNAVVEGKKVLGVVKTQTKKAVGAVKAGTKATINAMQDQPEQED